ncbi:MAG: THUMP domain-containing protein, partial [Candidatus Nanohaloarchaea archaeon]|nr:THUMP domain-containing protein [Candidatus Nanohaloarchaea archaeon]
VLQAECEGHAVVDAGERYMVFDADDVDFRRLAMTKEIGAVLASAPTLEELDVEAVDCGGSFAVRCTMFGDCEHSSRGVEERVGAAIQEETGCRVELDDPDTVFRVYITSEEVYLCRQETLIDTGKFEDRRSHLRPFSSPVSLHPKLARTLVNLAGVKAGDAVLDPFCGTGGILIEAGLIGCAVYGSDVSEEMVEGCRENLAAHTIEGEVRQAPIEGVEGVFDRDFDAVVTDLPYGRASRKEGEDLELYRTFLDRAKKLCTGRVVFVSNMPDVLGLEHSFSVYVHSSLSRYIYVAGGDDLKTSGGEDEV